MNKDTIFSLMRLLSEAVMRSKPNSALKDVRVTVVPMKALV